MTAIIAAAGSAEFVNIEDENITESVGPGDPARAGYELRSNGELWEIFQQSPAAFLSRWLYGGAKGDNYEGRATVISGSLDGLSDGVWYSLDVDREWFVAVGPGSSQGCTFDMDIRRGSTILDTARIVLLAESS